MNKDAQKLLIRNTILTELAMKGMYFFPVAVSARHVHLSKKDFEILFGSGKTMTRYRDLSQPGQFACEETVEVVGPKGSIKKLTVLWPERAETQIEISISDSFVLGIKPEIRMSGDIAGTPGCTLTGPAGKLTIDRGVIVAARHVHLSEEQSAAYRLKDGDVVFIRTPAPREGIIGNIAVRVGKDFDLEVHLDTDEANGNGILCGAIFEAGFGSPRSASLSVPAAQKPPAINSALELVTERDVNAALLRGEKTLYCTAGGFISPAAADKAREKGITLCKLRV
jgi:propanediol utilization protein